MKSLKAIWIYGLIIVIVASHVAVITYVRSRVAKLRDKQSESFHLGEFQFQHVSNRDTIYQFDLYATLDPIQKHRARMILADQKVLVSEAIGQMMRQSELSWLSDPKHEDLKGQMMTQIKKTLNEELIKELHITGWLELPVSPGGLASRPRGGSLNVTNTGLNESR